MEPESAASPRRLLLTLRIVLDPAAQSRLEGPRGSVLMLPFGGSAEGALFQGRVCPGGVDVQHTDAAGVNHMCARYMLEGTDCAGAPCRIYIENIGRFSRPLRPGEVFHTAPVFLTDSAALAPLLHTGRHVGEGLPGEDGGLTLRFYALTET